MVAAGRGGVRALNSNFGHYCQAGYERFLKCPKPPPPLRRRERKRQGDASCFNSALELTIIPGPDDNPPPALVAVLRKNPGKYYAVKCFPSTGYTQVPGVISPDLSDGSFAVAIWARFLTEAGVGINPALPVSYRRMADYGELQVPPSPPERSRDPQSGPHRRISEIRERIGRGASVSNPRDQAPPGWPEHVVQVCLSGGIKVRVKAFYRGKVNILGARDTESPLAICDYLSALFHAHWREFVVLQPLPDKAKWDGVAVARFLTFLRLRGFAKMVAEILVALTKNALSSEPQGRLGWGLARGALARWPWGLDVHAPDSWLVWWFLEGGPESWVYEMLVVDVQL